jgi:Uma2 family endonuclease
MSAAPRFDPTIGIAGLRMSADEYFRLGELPDRTELVHGVVVMSPSPRVRHSDVVVEILYQLKAGARAGGFRVLSETDVYLSESVVYRPDICVYNAGRVGSDPQRLDLPPDLVVEVLSAGTKAYDLITKRDDYECFGVGEYWAVDPNDASLRCWRRQKSRLAEVPIEGDTVPSSAIAGFTLDLGPIRTIAAGR